MRDRARPLNHKKTQLSETLAGLTPSLLASAQPLVRRDRSASEQQKMKALSAARRT
jgi:hypothetical protein